MSQHENLAEVTEGFGIHGGDFWNGVWKQIAVPASVRGSEACSLHWFLLWTTLLPKSTSSEPYAKGNDCNISQNEGLVSSRFEGKTCEIFSVETSWQPDACISQAIKPQVLLLVGLHFY